MKSHISATIEKKLLEELREVGRKERRSLSNVLEAAVAEFVEKRQASDELITSPGRFVGRFSRKRTYARPRR